MTCLTQLLRRLGGKLYVFCLLPTHQHFLLEINQKDIQAFTDEIHRFYGRKGFSNKPDMRVAYIHVEPNFFAARVSCFIHALPVLTGIVRSLDVYHWSSYTAYTGKGKSQYVTGIETVKAQVVRSYLRSGYEYKKYVDWFVNECFEDYSALLDAESCSSIGSRRFREKVSTMNEKLLRVVPRQKEPVSIEIIDAVLANYSDLSSVHIRLLKIYLARCVIRLTNKEIAASCENISVSRVSQLYGQSVKRYSQDPVFRGIADEIICQFRDSQNLQ